MAEASTNVSPLATMTGSELIKAPTIIKCYLMQPMRRHRAKSVTSGRRKRDAPYLHSLPPIGAYRNTPSSFYAF